MEAKTPPRSPIAKPRLLLCCKNLCNHTQGPLIVSRAGLAAALSDVASDRKLYRDKNCALRFAPSAEASRKSCFHLRAKLLPRFRESSLFHLQMVVLHVRWLSSPGTYSHGQERGNCRTSWRDPDTPWKCHTVREVPQGHEHVTLRGKSDLDILVPG